MFNETSILITGATGTLGSYLIEHLLSKHSNIKRIVIYSRGEFKQHQLRLKYPKSKFPMLEFKVGDIRDRERLLYCCKGIDVLIHAAAMKHIPICEENPEECIKTNVDGTKNVIIAARENNIRKVLLFSTDKAVDPISVYGNSKQTAEKLFLNANSETNLFSIVRFGNILGSRGSVVPFWKKQKEVGFLPITHPDMTRFGGSIKESIDLIFYALEHMKGGELFVKKLASFNIMNLADAICHTCRKEIIGLRGHEKIHEHFLSEIDANKALENKNYVIVPETKLTNDQGLDRYKALPLKDFDCLDSFKTKDKLNVADLKEIVFESSNQQLDYNPSQSIY